MAQVVRWCLKQVRSNLSFKVKKLRESSVFYAVLETITSGMTITTLGVGGLKINPKGLKRLVGRIL